MKKNFSAFLIVLAVGSACAAFVVSGAVAHAYEIPSGGQLPVPNGPGAAGSPQGSQGYDFGTSFSNLISPFTNFFNSIQHQNIAPVNLNMGGGSSPNVTITINIQQYVDQYITEIDAWFYGVAGVHIQWLLFLIVNFFYWVFGVANNIVAWIVSQFHH